MTEEQNGSVPESGTKKPEQATVKKKAAAKSNASLGEQYLGALFKCASWISPAYKEMAEKVKGKLEVLKELYLCSCDGVSEEKALETLDKDNPEVMLRFIRQKCVEERATKGYEEELKEIRKAAALVRHEMQDMKYGCYVSGRRASKGCCRTAGRTSKGNYKEKGAGIIRK